MTPAELAALLISAAIKLKSAGMVLDKDPSENFNDLATLVSIAYAESEQGNKIGTGQSILEDEEGNREQSFGPFQVNEFWYKDHSDSGDTTLVNNKFTDIFNDKTPEEMEKLVQNPENAALAAIIIANSNNGYENWSVYNSKVYGIGDQDFDSKYWRTGFNTAAEEYFKIPKEDMTEDRDKPIEPAEMPVFTPQGPLRSRMPVYTSEAEYTGRTPVIEPQNKYRVEGGLGKAMRARGYGDREVVRFQNALDKLIADFFPGQEDNEEVIRQTTIAAAQSIGMPSNAMSLEEAQNLDTVKNVVKDFVYQIGKRKAMLSK